MKKGKEICNELKAVRRRIAEENGIPLDIPECPYQGPCPGTCPRCEQELRQLESALADRLRLGKVATVAGLALGLAVGTAQAQESTIKDSVRATVHTTTLNNAVKVRGTVLDEKTKEPLPFVNVVFKQEGTHVLIAVTDFDGIFNPELPEGEYDVELRCIGYYRKDIKVNITKATRKLGEILLTPSATLSEGIVIESDAQPLIEIGPNGTSQTLEIEGVKVNVR